MSDPLSQSESTLGGSMEEEDDQPVEEHFLPARIDPFAKMSQMSVNPPDKDSTIPVKFRRNLFDDGSVIEPNEKDYRVAPVQAFQKPAHHMRGQARVPYSAMNPEERRLAELQDTAADRQQLLLRQQQEVMAYQHQQLVNQQAQQLVNKSLTVGTTSTTPLDRQLQHQADQNRLQALLNEACVLAPPRGLEVRQMPGMLGGGAGMWMPVAQPQPSLVNMVGQEELMKAVRKDLKRLQQE